MSVTNTNPSRRARPVASVVAGLVLLAALPGTIRAQEYRVETFRASPPDEVAEAVATTLSGEAVRVVGPEGTFAEIWFREAVPVKADASMTLSVAYPDFIEGALVGVVRLARATEDYKSQAVTPGVYTLRYLLHPVDGNHMGVAPQRDFLLLSAAAEDTALEPLSFAELYSLSGQSAGTGHAALWSFTYPEDYPQSPPELIHWEDEGHWLLYVNLTVQPEGGDPQEKLVALVVVGQAAEA